MGFCVSNYFQILKLKIHDFWLLFKEWQIVIHHEKKNYENLALLNFVCPKSKFTAMP